VYLNVNFNVFFKLIKVHLLVSELYKFITTLKKKVTHPCIEPNEYSP